MTVGRRGAAATVGLPGTGMFYSHRVGSKSGASYSGSRPTQSREAPGRAYVPDRLNPGFLQKLFTPGDEIAFVEGLRLLFEGSEGGALAKMEGVTHLADAAWMAGMLRLKREDLSQAQRHLQAVQEREGDLNRLFEKYEYPPRFELHITEELEIDLYPTRPCLLLALAEIDQANGDLVSAARRMATLHKEVPGNILAVVSLAELMHDAHIEDDSEGEGERAAHEIVRVARDRENETEPHAVALLYKARALRYLGLDREAITPLSKAVRRKKGRSERLICQLPCERGLAREAARRRSLARADFGSVYARDPEFEDVRDRVESTR